MSPPLVRAERVQIKLLNHEFPVQPCWPSATVAQLPKDLTVLCSVLDRSAFLGPFNFQGSFTWNLAKQTLKKPKSALLKSQVAVILLFILLASLRILNSTNSRLLQPRLPLAFTSLTSFSLFVSNRSSREPLLGLLIPSIKNFFTTLKGTLELLAPHLVALPGDVRVVKTPHEDQGLEL